MCSALFIRASGTWGAVHSGGGVMKVSVLYLVTQSRGQFRLPVFFSPDLGRPAACRLQALLSPPTCSLQCSEGAEISGGRQFIIRDDVHIRLLSSRFLPGFWTNRVRNFGIDSGLWSISLQCALQCCVHSAGIMIGLLPPTLSTCSFSNPISHS